jgi:outer membrane protein assembly factor BamB
MHRSVLPLLVALPLLLILAPVALAARGDWPMFGHDPQRTFTNRASDLRPTNVGNLQRAWTFPTDDAITAAASVVDGVVYVGAWDGNFYALRQQDGTLVWKFAVDCQNAVVPVPPRCLAPDESPPDRSLSDGGLITSSAAVVDDKVYFGGGRTLYCLNAADGSLRWKQVICGNPDDPHCAADTADGTRIFSSPVVHAGLVFVGLSADGQVGYRGGFMAFDADTGTPRWRFEVDPLLDAAGNPLLNAQGLPVGGRNRGCGSVWSSASVDAEHVFFTTGDCDFDAPPPFHEAVMALEPQTGRLQWVFRPRQSDVCDFDFGATANVINSGQKRWLGVGGKDGTYYMLERHTKNPQGELVWATNVVFGGNGGGFFGGAVFDGTRIVSATALGDLFACMPQDPRDVPFQEPSGHAFNLRTGEVVWQQTLAQSFAATTAGDGVVFISTIGIPGVLPGAVKVYEAATGALLVTLSAPPGLAPVTPVYGMILLGFGNPQDGTNSGLNAYKLR